MTEGELKSGTQTIAVMPPMTDDLLRPEPKTDQVSASASGFAVFGLAFAGLALLAIYISSPVDLPEFPDCPIQSIGSCGHR